MIALFVKEYGNRNKNLMIFWLLVEFSNTLVEAIHFGTAGLRNLQNSSRRNLHEQTNQQ
jgi:hypothetical protein